jgi:hypothetical protein
MYKRVLVIAAVGLALGVAWNQAKKADAAAAARFNAVIVGSPVIAEAASPCPGTGFVAICPSGDCQCLKVTDGTLTSVSLGRGTATLNLTEDKGNKTSTAENNCLPFFGTAVLTGTNFKKVSKTGNVNVVGADCTAFTTNGPESLTGGFGVAVPSPSPAVNGWGVLTGTINSKGVLRLTMRGGPVS